MDYEATATELGKRILRLIPAHPEILTMKNATELHTVSGFKCDDLAPSLGQAIAALGWARHKFVAMAPAMFDALTQWANAEKSNDPMEMANAALSRAKILMEYARATAQS